MLGGARHRIIDTAGSAPTPYLWYDFSDTSTLYTSGAGTTLITPTDGASVLRVNDKSGNGFYVTANAGTCTYRTNLSNGRAGVRLASWRLSTAGASGSPDWRDGTVFAVAKTGSAGYLFYHGPSATYGGHSLYNPSSSTSYVHFGSASSIAGPVSGFYNTAIYAIYEQEYVGGTTPLHVIRRDGTDFASTTSSAGTGASAHPLSISGGEQANFNNADYLEFRVYKGALTTAQKAAIRAELKAKWGTA